MTDGISIRPAIVPQRARRSVGLLPALLVTAGGAGTLVGLLGAPWLPGGEDRLYWSLTFDVFNNFLPIWAMLLALGLIMALARRRPTSRLFLAMNALLLTGALAPIGLEVHRAPVRVEHTPGAGTGERIRLVQFNAFNPNTELGGALDLALEQDADLLLIEEPRAFRRLEPYIRARYPYSTRCPRDRCKAIIYSRLRPIEADYETVRGAEFQPGVSDPTGILGMASMRLEGPDGEPFTVVAMHFRWPFPPMAVLRQRQVFLGRLAEMDLERAIVAGDFNLTPWTFEMRRLDAEIGPMQRVTRALFTYPAQFRSKEIPLPFPILPIDHVYAGNRWDLVEARRGPDGGSDHYPVIVDLVMPPLARED